MLETANASVPASPPGVPSNSVDTYTASTIPKITAILNLDIVPPALIIYLATSNCMIKMVGKQAGAMVMVIVMTHLVTSLMAAPCDIYAAHGTPCAAAHSMTRSLYSDYSGRLYQLSRSSGNATQDIHALGPGGLADVSAHESFCANSTTVFNSKLDPSVYPSRADCVVLKIYDQTGNGNHLLPATPAVSNPAFDLPVNATRHPITIGGHRVYGAYFETGMGYRAQNTTLVATGNDPETIYMVTSGTHINSECCFVSCILDY